MVAVNNSARSRAPFSFLEVELIKIAWPKVTGEEVAGTPHIGTPTAVSQPPVPLLWGHRGAAGWE